VSRRHQNAKNSKKSAIIAWPRHFGLKNHHSACRRDTPNDPFIGKICPSIQYLSPNRQNDGITTD
jgi:hypothetical protein